MMTIKTEECPILFDELKAGDVFSFTTAPDIVYIKTDKKYCIDFECEECTGENSIDVEALCVELATGAFCEGCAWDKVILYKNVELTLSR